MPEIPVIVSYDDEHAFRTSLQSFRELQLNPPSAVEVAACGGREDVCRVREQSSLPMGHVLTVDYLCYQSSADKVLAVGIPASTIIEEEVWYDGGTLLPTQRRELTLKQDRLARWSDENSLVPNAPKAVPHWLLVDPRASIVEPRASIGVPVR